MSDSEAQKDVDSGDSSKANSAMSWGLGMKLYHTVIPCFLAFLITFSASVTVPATTALMTEFAISRTVAILSETMYMLGLAFGPMILAPLSEFIGRRWLYVATSSCIIAFAGGAGAARNFATFLICRFLCGFLGSAGIAIGAGTLMDVWGIGSKAGAMATLLFICGPFFGPSLGPLVGAYVMNEYHGDWRWTQWVVALIGAPVWILILLMKETSGTRVEATGTANYSGRFRIVRLALSTLKAAVFRSMTMLTTETIAFLLTLYTGYAYAVIFSFFASATYVYTLDYGFDARTIGLSFISVLIGYLLACVTYMVIEKTLYARATRQAPNSRPAPEHRLYSAMAGSIFLPIGLFWYAWAAHPGGHWAVVVASGIPFGLGAFVLFIVDVTFGPEGPKRTRRHLVEEEPNTDSDNVCDGAEGDSELVNDVVENSLPSGEIASLPSTSNQARHAGIFSSVEQQPPVDAYDVDIQRRPNADLDRQNDVAIEFASLAGSQEEALGNHPNRRRSSVTSERRSPFTTGVSEQPMSPSLGEAENLASHTEGDSPASCQTLDLAVLDYLASNPFNLGVLADSAWPETAVASDDTMNDVVLQDFSPPAIDFAAGNPFDLCRETFRDVPAYKELHCHLHDHMMKTARTMVLTRQGTPEAAPSTAAKSPRQPAASWMTGRKVCASPPHNQDWLADLPITEKRCVELWQNYLDEISPWLDMFDNENHWRTTVAHMAQRVECLQYAVLALSARQQERKNPGKPPTESLNLYQGAIRLMKVQLPTLCTEVIAACVLLCVLEMMCSSPHAWEKHLDGCAILLEAAGINGVVGGVRGALFWTFARMDVYRALIGDTVTTLPTNRWFISADSMAAAVRLFQNKPGSDNYANYVVFLCAGVVNILSNKRLLGPVPDHNSYTTFVSRWKAMYDLHEGWFDNRPEEIQPLMYVPPSKKDTHSAFSTILYSTPVGISSNQMYHASMILLLQDKPKEVTLPRSHKSMLWHARQICGISLSNGDHGALINALQPMWLAGRLMSHHSEHKAILDILKHVEEQTGWATSYRVEDLREFWGVSDEEL
ncbi:Major facilitator superfamily domain, general substrate transporter [Niveomyces insectorum RCEF 264]|uniref:Major facilitator superfamily domain, general substrate transporter n=1 Tax=Niveomyces insectorum RCEF 264 TaxID=1081102 RepID=A0A162J8I8_9HYPO|nr:Major facilitator superfamily domain, general substrate transporter [Niveomyces insectorum RCEF 264]